MKWQASVWCGICAIVVLAGTAGAETVTHGARSWSYATYQARLKPLRRLYKGYPIGLNIRKEFWPLQLNRAKFTFHTWTVSSPGLPKLDAVTYSSAINIDNDADFEILQCGWKSDQASAGHLAVVDFKNGKYAGVRKACE